MIYQSLGRAPVSDEILKDLKEMVEKTTDIHSLFISTIWCTTMHLSQNH
jgi:hypothetical protein